MVFEDEEEGKKPGRKDLVLEIFVLMVDFGVGRR